MAIHCWTQKSWTFHLTRQLRRYQVAKKLISFFINLTHGKLKKKRSIVQVELIALRHCVTCLVTRGTLLPLVVLICQLVVLVYPLVVLVCPLVVLVCLFGFLLVVSVCLLVVFVWPFICPLVVFAQPFVCPLVVLIVLSVGIFITDRQESKNMESRDFGNMSMLLI